MNRISLFIGLLVIIIISGCNSDIVCTERLKELDSKCVYIEPLSSEDPHVGQVLRDALEKELIRQKISICDENSATIILTGSTFLTVRGSGANAGQSIESVSLVGKDRSGQVLLSASYDNKEKASASKISMEFGSALAAKLK